jgi:predicted dehydrogenase
MVSEDMKVAVIGAGSMAREHIRVFQDLPKVDVVGIYSRTRKRCDSLAQEFGIDYVADSIEELYERTKAKLVVIAVPELATNAVTKAAVRLPWAILMEKPAGYDLSDAEDIAAACEGRNAPVMVGFNRRFYSSVMAIRDDLDGLPNARRFIHVQDQQSYAEARLHNHPEPVVEKFMYANSIHLIDMIMAFGRGSVSRVNQVTPWLGSKTEIMLAHIEFDSGDSALYEGIWQGPGPWACAVSTVERRWTMQPLEAATFQNAGERITSTLEPSVCDLTFKPGFMEQAKAAIEHTLGAESGITTIDCSLKTMRLINRIFGV